MTPFVKGATGAAMIMTATTAQAHDWLHHMVDPRTGKQCCDEKDCKPRQPCLTQDGQGGLRIEENGGKCMPIGDSIVPGESTPDGLTWGCWWPHDGPNYMRCTIPGGTT